MSKPSKQTIVICVFIFLFFLLLQFPFKNFRGQIFETVYKNTGVLISSDDIGLSFFGWPGIVLDNVYIDAQRSGIQISAQEAIVRVGLGRLWPPTPSYAGTLNGLESGGDLWFRYTGGTTLHDVELEGTNLGCDLFAFGKSSSPVNGKLNAEVDLAMDANNLAATSGYLDLTAQELEIAAQNFQQFFKLPQTKINDIKARIDVKNGIAVIKNFEFGSESSDLKGRISGEMQLGQSFPASHLKLRLDITLSPNFAADSRSIDLRSFLGGYRLAGESYAMQWNSSIAQMQNNLFSAIPQKVQ